MIKSESWIYELNEHRMVVEKFHLKHTGWCVQAIGKPTCFQAEHDAQAALELLQETLVFVGWKLRKYIDPDGNSHV